MADLCSRNSTIASYFIPEWRCDGQWAANTLLYCREVKASTSRSIARLIVGGQDLRGGDPTCDEHPSRLNCWVPCLERHRYHAETLQHVCFDCAAYADLRHVRCIAAALAERNPNTFCLHCDV